MTLYYVGHIDDSQQTTIIRANGYNDYDAAVREQGRRLVQEPSADRPQIHIFLDLFSINTQDIHEIHHALMTDPVLSAIYKLGIQHGRAQEKREHA